MGLSPCDALLDSHDPGLHQATIDPLFTELGAELPALIQEAQERRKEPPATQPLSGPSLSMINDASASI